MRALLVSFVVQREFNPGRCNFPKPLIYEAKPDDPGVRAEAVARLRVVAHLSRLEHILRTVARGLEVQRLKEPVFSLLPSLS